MNRIYLELEKQGRTQMWLSKQIGKSYNMVNSYCNNRRQPSIEILFKISQVLEVKVSELLNQDYLKFKHRF
jgi:transcriptional regulator with XRE-family HTH domain